MSNVVHTTLFWSNLRHTLKIVKDKSIEKSHSGVPTLKSVNESVSFLSVQTP